MGAGGLLRQRGGGGRVSALLALGWMGVWLGKNRLGVNGRQSLLQRLDIDVPSSLPRAAHLSLYHLAPCPPAETVPPPASSSTHLWRS